MTKIKKREWWLDIATPYGDPCDFIHNEDPMVSAKRNGIQPIISATNIHVIAADYHEQELAARDAEIAELKLMLADRTDKYNIAIDKGVDVLSDDRDKWKAMALELGTALRRYSTAAIGFKKHSKELFEYNDENKPIKYGTAAREALAKLEEMK